MIEMKSFVQRLHQINWRFRTATTLDEVLCFTVMVANGLLEHTEDIEESRRKWLEDYNGVCENCPCHETCVANIVGSE